MQPTQGQLNNLGASTLPKVAITTITTVPAQAPAALPSPGPLAWRPASMRKPEMASTLPQAARCSERGCVFPAAPGCDGKCLHHLRQSREPILFSSYQPTRAVLDRGRFGVPSEEIDTSRNRDRRQLVAMREAFLED
ncbi:MAG: hypothetical protein ACRD18_04985 [Terriglobia bacterium]